jgi:hypothetical protein
VSARLANLLAFGTAALGLSMFGVNVYLTLLTFLHDHHHNDFTYYFAAARIGLAHGWNRIFDLGLQNTELGILSPGLGVAFQSRYLNPPPLAWLAVPFTALRYDLAYWLWVGLGLGAVVLAWWLSTAGLMRIRVALLLVALGLLPVGFAIQLGQPALLVAGVVAVAAWLLRGGRQVSAGLVLSLAAIKPQLVWLVPPALLLAGFSRAFVAWIAGSAVLAAVALASLGSIGLQQYLDLLRYAESLPVNHHLVVADVFGAGLQARVLEAGFAVATLVAARLRGGEGSDTVVAVGLLGSVVAGPYLHLADMMVLVLAGWLYLRTPRPAVTWAVLAAGALTMEFAYSVTPLPFFAVEAGCLLLLAFGRAMWTGGERFLPGGLAVDAHPGHGRSA